MNFYGLQNYHSKSVWQCWPLKGPVCDYEKGCNLKNEYILWSIGEKLDLTCNITFAQYKVSHQIRVYFIQEKTLKKDLNSRLLMYFSKKCMYSLVRMKLNWRCPCTSRGDKLQIVKVWVLTFPLQTRSFLDLKVWCPVLSQPFK